MHREILEETVARVRQRAAEGDCPITAPFSVEHLENAVIDLADALRNRTSEPEAREGEAWKDQRLSRIERVKTHRVAFGSDLKTAINAVDEHAAVANILAKIPAPSESDDRLRVAVEALKRIAGLISGPGRAYPNTYNGGFDAGVDLTAEVAADALAALSPKEGGK